MYTPMEEVLVKGALLAQALETKKKALELEALDSLLLEMEAKANMMDGMKMEEWIL